MTTRRRFVFGAAASLALPGQVSAQQRQSLDNPFRLGADQALVDSGLAAALRKGFGRDTGVVVQIVPGLALPLLEALERKTIRRLYRLNRLDFALSVVAVFGVLTFEALEGLLIAVILSLLALVWRASQSKLSVLGREPGRYSLSDTRRHPENRAIPGLLILRPDEGVFFANADALRSEIFKLVDAAQPPVKGPARPGDEQPAGCARHGHAG